MDHSGTSDSRVCAGFDARNEVGGRESNLLDLGKVVLYVFIEYNLADFLERIFLMTPDFSEIEDVVAVRFGLLWRHYLLLVTARMSTQKSKHIIGVSGLSQAYNGITKEGTDNVDSPRGELALLDILK